MLPADAGPEGWLGRDPRQSFLKYLNNIFRAQRRNHGPSVVSGARAALVTFLSAALAVGVITTPAIAASVPSPTAAAVSGPGAAPTSLTVGQLDSPVDVESLAAPLLGWQVGAGTQSAYQVQVATSSGSLSGTPDVWDSAKFTSSKNASVTYAGPTLTSSSGYYWRVRTWDAADTASAWSAVSHFGTGPGSTWAGASPIWLPSSQGWTDYTFEGTFKIQANNASITFRAKDTSNFYMWQFRGNGENTLAPHTNVGGTFTQLKTVALPFALVTGTVYKFKISIQGSTITTYLNDVLVDTTTSSTFISGGVGFRTGATEQAYYDDLLVTNTSGTMLYSNDFSAASTDFSCGSIVSGQLFVDKSKNCVTGAPDSTSWAFLRGDVTLQPGKDIAWAHVYATGASAEPSRQFVYKLSVNGSFVGVGPTRSIGSETRYDGYDVTSLLHLPAPRTPWVRWPTRPVTSGSWLSSSSATPTAPPRPSAPARRGRPFRPSRPAPCSRTWAASAPRTTRRRKRTSTRRTTHSASTAPASTIRRGRPRRSRATSPRWWPHRPRRCNGSCAHRCRWSKSRPATISSTTGALGR